MTPRQVAIFFLFIAGGLSFGGAWLAPWPDLARLALFVIGVFFFLLLMPLLGLGTRDWRVLIVLPAAVFLWIGVSIVVARLVVPGSPIDIVYHEGTSVIQGALDGIGVFDVRLVLLLGVIYLTLYRLIYPRGESGIGIIRISGPLAEVIFKRLFRPRRNKSPIVSHQFHYGEIVDPERGASIDEALLVFMKSPKTYRREDIVEIHCHGGYLVLQKVLELVLRQGARMAQPGEFTKRAFLNGRIDLTQAVSCGRSDTIQDHGQP